MRGVRRSRSGALDRTGDVRLLGATGTRLLITLLHELRRRKAKYGLSTACIGGGQGIAVIVENLQR